MKTLAANQLVLRAADDRLSLREMLATGPSSNSAAHPALAVAFAVIDNDGNGVLEKHEVELIVRWFLDAARNHDFAAEYLPTERNAEEDTAAVACIVAGLMSHAGQVVTNGRRVPAITFETFRHWLADFMAPMMETDVEVVVDEAVDTDIKQPVAAGASSPPPASASSSPAKAPASDVDNATSATTAGPSSSSPQSVAAASASDGHHDDPSSAASSSSAAAVAAGDDAAANQAVHDEANGGDVLDLATVAATPVALEQQHAAAKTGVDGAADSTQPPATHAVVDVAEAAPHDTAGSDTDAAPAAAAVHDQVVGEEFDHQDHDVGQASGRA